MSTTPPRDLHKVRLEFAWIGPNTWFRHVVEDGLQVQIAIRIVNLLFQDASGRISVHLPAHINPTTTQKMSFTYRLPWGQIREAHALHATAAQIRTLIVRAVFFEYGEPKDSSETNAQRPTISEIHTVIPVGIHEYLDADHTYTLVVSATDRAISAYVKKAETNDHSTYTKSVQPVASRPTDFTTANMKNLPADCKMQ